MDRGGDRIGVGTWWGGGRKGRTGWGKRGE